MCLPVKSDQPSVVVDVAADAFDRRPRRADAARLSGRPAIAGVVGSLGFGILVGAGGVVFALALCAAIPAGALAWRRRSARRAPAPEL